MSNNIQKSKPCFIYFWRKRKIRNSFYKFWQAAQCVTSKMSSLYVIANPFILYTIIFTFFLNVLGKNMVFENVPWLHIHYASTCAVLFSKYYLLTHNMPCITCCFCLSSRNVLDFKFSNKFLSDFVNFMNFEIGL